MMKGGVVGAHDAAGAVFGKGEIFLDLIAQLFGHGIQKRRPHRFRQDQQDRGAHGAAAFFEQRRDSFSRSILHQVRDKRRRQVQQHTFEIRRGKRLQHVGGVVFVQRFQAIGAGHRVVLNVADDHRKQGIGRHHR